MPIAKEYPDSSRINYEYRKQEQGKSNVHESIGEALQNR
jgi:hypothetical protein